MVDYILKPFDADLLRSKVSIFFELQRGRRVLERSEGLLRASFDYAPVGKTVLNSSLRIVRANPSFARLLGRPPAALEDVEIAGLCVLEQDCYELVDALRAVAAGEAGPTAPERGGLDVRLRGPNGRDVWVTLIASAIDSGELSGALLLAQWVDLSARRRAEAARAELMMEQAARSTAEHLASRLNTLQALTDVLSTLPLEPDAGPRARGPRPRAARGRARRGTPIRQRVAPDRRVRDRGGGDRARLARARSIARAGDDPLRAARARELLRSRCQAVDRSTQPSGRCSTTRPTAPRSRSARRSSTTRITGSRSSSSAGSCPSGCPTWQASSSPPTTQPPAPGPRSAAIGTTRSRYPKAGLGSCSAM